MKIIEKIYHTIALVLFYFYKLITSNVYIAFDILTPRMRINPGFIDVPVFLKSNTGVLMFSNLVSMTPGTLSIDLNDDKTILRVHYLYNSINNSVLDEINQVQKKINKVFN